MSLMTKEIVVPVSDLQFMTVECSVCQTAVVLDMMKIATTGENVVAQEGITPAQCPFCKTQYDVTPDTINGFRRFYRDRINGKTKISFRVRAEWQG